MCGRWLCARKFSDLNFLTHTTSRLKKSILWRIFAICYNPANSRCLQNGIFSKQRMEWGFCRLSAKTPMRLPLVGAPLSAGMLSIRLILSLLCRALLDCPRCGLMLFLASVLAVGNLLRPVCASYSRCLRVRCSCPHAQTLDCGRAPPKTLCHALLLCWRSTLVPRLNAPLLFAFCCCIIAILLHLRSFIIFI